MCAASDARPAEQRIVSALGLFAEKQAEQDKIATERARRQRKSTLIAIELAITDDAIRSAVCTAAKLPADCK